MSRSLVAGLALAALSVAPSAFAQGSTPPPSVYTFVAEWELPRNQWGNYVTDFDKNTRPVLEKLAADGTLVSWGIYEMVVHMPGETTHGIWWSSPTYAGIEKARGQLVASSAASASLAAATSHRDRFLRTVVSSVKPGGTAGTGYLGVSINLTQPGKANDWRELWTKNTKPILDDLLAKGTLTSYAIYVEDVHTEHSGLRYVSMVTPSAEAEDAVGNAFEAADAKLTPQERQTNRLQMDAVLDRTAHRDLFAKVIRYWQK